jgi:hypothetical protein
MGPELALNYESFRAERPQPTTFFVTLGPLL